MTFQASPQPTSLAPGWARRHGNRGGYATRLNLFGMQSPNSSPAAHERLLRFNVREVIQDHQKSWISDMNRYATLETQDISITILRLLRTRTRTTKVPRGSRWSCTAWQSRPGKTAHMNSPLLLSTVLGQVGSTNGEIPSVTLCGAQMTQNTFGIDGLCHADRLSPQTALKK